MRTMQLVDSSWSSLFVGNLARVCRSPETVLLDLDALWEPCSLLTLVVLIWGEGTSGVGCLHSNPRLVQLGKTSVHLSPEARSIWLAGTKQSSNL